MVVTSIVAAGPFPMSVYADTLTVYFSPGFKSFTQSTSDVVLLLTLPYLVIYETVNPSIFPLVSLILGSVQLIVYEYDPRSTKVRS